MGTPEGTVILNTSKRILYKIGINFYEISMKLMFVIHKRIISLIIAFISYLLET